MDECDVRCSLLPQIQGVLTPEKQTQFNAALAQGREMRVVLSSFSLSSAQQLKLHNLLQSVRSPLTQTLTPEQQQQVLEKARSLR